MKFPYGIADFYKLITGGYFYVDRTACIPQLESMGEQLLFLRPRRFGKSLWLSTLENYYDLKKAVEFDRLFGSLAIGAQPTPSHNQYFVLRWDFSGVKPHGDTDAIERALHEYLNKRIADFAAYYDGQLARPIEIEPSNALASFQSLLTAVRLTPHKLYLLIDEYDNFANEILMGGTGAGSQRYDSLLRGEGALKTLFKTIKSATSGGGLDRVFITGVAPLVLSDMTSGYNVAENIYLNPDFQQLCGFTEAEVCATLAAVTTTCGLSDSQAAQAQAQMRDFYNGYRFTTEVITEAAGEPLYNPTLALYYFKHFQRRCVAPEDMLDSNLAMDRGKLNYIAALPGGAALIVAALHDETTLSVSQLANRFGVEDMLTVAKDTRFMLSLLYYFGVLTLAGRDAFGKLRLRIPNLVIRKLYLERLQTMLLPETTAQEASQRAAEMFYQNGDLQPVCEFIEQHYFKVFSNRDYLHANELTLKTALLTLLYNDTLYVMDSETQAGRRYADLTLLVRPEARQYQLFDLLIACKFIKLGDLGLSGEAVCALSRAELAALPLVRQKLQEARAQALAYRREVEVRYQSLLNLNLRLRAYAVVAVGFERLVWEEISN
jgi:hypothetical protein